MVTLDSVPLGQQRTLAKADLAFEQTRRLATLGLRTGAPVSVVGRTSGGGRIVAVAGSRIALDRGTAARVYVQ